MAAVAEAPDRTELISTGGHASALLAKPVSNEPFSAMQSTVTTKTLLDGTKVTRKGHHFVARDSMGRVRVESRLTNGKDGKPELKMVYVKDPVAGTLTTWMEGGSGNGKHVAFVAKMPANGGLELCGCGEERRSSSKPEPVVTVKDLGSSIVDDVAVTGTLKTTVVPVERSGADKPITKSHEVWTSAEMKLIVKQVFEDPREGERVVELVNMVRAEPAAGLFRAPAGYETKSAMESLKETLAKLEAVQE